MNSFFAEALCAIRPLLDRAAIVDFRGTLETRRVEEDLCWMRTVFGFVGFAVLVVDALVDLDELDLEETEPFCAASPEGMTTANRNTNRKRRFIMKSSS